MGFSWAKESEPEPESEPAPEPTDPILYCGVEKLVAANGEEILFDKARVVHSIDGTVIRGYVVDASTGSTTQAQRMVPKSAISRHVAMWWRNSDKTLHEMVGETPFSLTR